jgi:hypothetical protein
MLFVRPIPPTAGKTDLTRNQMPMLSVESYSSHEEISWAYKNLHPSPPRPKKHISAKQRLVAVCLRTMLPSSENPKPKTLPPLFSPQTLDQYLDPGMADTGRYDADQVVYRYQKMKSRKTNKILVVEKLWLWNDSCECLYEELYYKRAAMVGEAGK